MAYIQENPLETEHFQRMRALVGDRKFDRMLDLGCGTGFLASFFRDCCKHIMAIDQIKENIEKAQVLYPELSFGEVNLEDEMVVGEYNLILFSDVIYYLSPKTQRRIMRNIHYCLSDDGFLLTSRHMGNGDAELDEYTYLFEKVKSEWVGHGDNPKKWHITLWKKKEEHLRSKKEIQLELMKIINSDLVDFPVLGTLFWASEVYNQILIRTAIDKMIQEHNSTEVIAIKVAIERCLLSLYWCLKIEDTEKWNDFQVTYHLPHNGPKEPDYRLAIFLEWIGEEKKVILDCGVHTGLHTNEFVKKGHIVTGIDLPQIIEKFKDRYLFNAIPCDVYKDMGMFEDESFDVVNAGEFIEHLNQPKIFINEIYGVLKKDGLLILSCPYKDFGPHDPTHCNSVDEDWLRELFGNKFVIEEVKVELKTTKGCLLVKCRKLG